jgi:acyl-CoA synthetase (AMP-forming)/AMP-acid ligase II/acyl carrier protein
MTKPERMNAGELECPNGDDRWSVPATLLDLLEARTAEFADERAFEYLFGPDGQSTLTYRGLDAEARGLAAVLQARVRPHDRVLLVFPPGLEFVKAFFGCVYAGLAAVPATHPKPRRPAPRVSAIAEDCQASAVLTTSQTLRTLDRSRLSARLQRLRWIGIDALWTDADLWQRPELEPDSLAFLQYTSGSTSAPKGVMVTHANLMHNLEMIRRGFDITPGSNGRSAGVGVSWLPPYHDMGLIGGILEPLYVGGCAVLMSPTSFLRRPERWLRAISEHRALVSGGPNFAYDLCVRRVEPQARERLDLSHWRVAFCGAEPVRPEILSRFAEEFEAYGFRVDAFYPCYGLAEATLLAAGGAGPAPPRVIRVRRSKLLDEGEAVQAVDDPADSRKLVSCGQGPDGQELIIADPERRLPCTEGQVGEIWLRGPSVSPGYWGRPDENSETFEARLADSGAGPFLRTGDLGFLYGGDLFVTGRRKELMIIRGRNYYPQDIELTVQQTSSALLPGSGAAFSVASEAWDEERLVVVQEVDRSHRNGDLDGLIRRIRRAITEEHEIDVHEVVLITQASLSRTTSGKVQRNVCRQRYLNDELRALARSAKSNGSLSGVDGARKRKAGSPVAWERLTEMLGTGRPLRGPEVDRLTDEIEQVLLRWLHERLGVPAGELDRDRPFAEYGVDSVAAVELGCELERVLEVELPSVVAWQYPTPAAMARHLALEAGRGASTDSPDAEPLEQAPTSGFEQLLAEIEGLSESEATGALRDGEGEG